jgi:hypothetical protein
VSLPARFPTNRLLYSDRAGPTARGSRGYLLSLRRGRPHSHSYQVLAQMPPSETGSGVIGIAGAQMCAFFTSWGDGLFPVHHVEEFALLGNRFIQQPLRVELPRAGARYQRRSA